MTQKDSLPFNYDKLNANNKKYTKVDHTGSSTHFKSLHVCLQAIRNSTCTLYELFWHKFECHVIVISVYCYIIFGISEFEIECKNFIKFSL